MTNLRREAETIGVDELVASQVRSRIARQDRVELDIGRSKQRHVADNIAGARNVQAVEVQVKVRVGAEACQIGAALNLCNAGDLPVIDHTTPDLVVREIAQLDRIGGVEDLLAVSRQHPVIVIQVELVREVHDPHGLAVRVIRADRVTPLCPTPGRL